MEVVDAATALGSTANDLSELADDPTLAGNDHLQRAIGLAMVLGWLRSGEVRSLRLADVDMAMGTS